MLQGVPDHNMLGIGGAGRGQIEGGIGAIPDEDEIPRCWGSTTAFKLAARSRTISGGTRQLRACTQLLTTGGRYGKMPATAQEGGNKNGLK